MRIVIAFGGNALIRAGRARHVGGADGATRREAARAVARAARARPRGRARRTATARRSARSLLQQRARRAARRPPLPLDALDAMTQGQIGYLLQTALAARRPDRADRRRCSPASRVDRRRPGVRATPTKPIGPFYDEAEARRLADERGWDVGAGRRAAAGGAWCRARGRVEVARAASTIERARRQRRGRHRRRRRRHPGRRAAAAGSSASTRVIDKDRCSAELGAARSAPTCSCCSPASPRVVARLRHALAARAWRG